MSDERAATQPPGGTGSFGRRETTEEVAKLRRSMIQQLTSSGKLLHAVFALDRDYFGSRFTGGEQPEGVGDPFQELGLATRIVETLAEELQGQSAFADSPVLRDSIASLVAGVESSRTEAIELERVQLEALNLPTKVEFPARSFPDNNPLACLSEAASFLRDLTNAVQRAKDRVGAMSMMLQDAEKRRPDSERFAAITAAAAKGGDAVGEVLRTELKARDDEVVQLRNQAKQLQEQAAADARRLQHHVDHLRHELGREQDLRRGDLAEARSLAAEIERLAGFEEQLVAREGVAATTDLTTNLAALREALADPDRSDAIATASETVLMEWARVVTARAQSSAADLARIKAASDSLQLTLQQQRDQLGRLADQDKAAGETARLRESIKGLEGELATARAQAAAAASDAAKLRSDVARITELERELARAQDGRRTAEAAAAAAVVDKQALAARVASLEGQVGERSKSGAEELAAARAEAQRVQAALDEGHARERHIVAELAKAREASAQASAALAELKSRLAALTEERDQLVARLDHGKEKTDAIARDRERATAELQRQIEALHEQIAELQDAADERAALKGKLDEMRRTSTIAEEKARVDRDDAGRQLTAAREQFAEEQRLHTQTRHERDQVRARLDDLRRATEAQVQQASDSQGQLGRELALMRDAEARLKSQVATASAEANRAAARAAELERELSGHREQAAARAREHAHAIDQLRAKETESREKLEAVSSELAQSKGKVSRLEHDLVQAKREIAGIAMKSTVPLGPPAEGEVGDLRRRVAEQQQLLIAAREAVVAAKKRCDELNATDRQIIASLMAQVEGLKKG